jgi:hypothetical protein
VSGLNDRNNRLDDLEPRDLVGYTAPRAVDV